MGVRISRREVLNNIVRFKDSLNDRQVNEKGRNRSYPVLLNKKTGDIQFAQKLEPLIHVPKKKAKAPEDWQEVQIDVSMKDGEVHFALAESPTGLERAAFQVINETLEALNRIAHEKRSSAKEGLPEKEILNDLSTIQLVSPHVRIDDLPGWLGRVSRLDAEKMLQNHSNGTYLLRSGGEDTNAIAFHLSEENHFLIKAYLCTVVESHEKISDILLLDTDRGWTIYLDNPDLGDPQYEYLPSAQALLHSISSRAKHPIH